jgi:predicted transcriptional regulator
LRSFEERKLSGDQKRRGTSEIVNDILKHAGRGERKTRIMYGSALNLNQLNRYFDLLTEQGLLAFDPKARLFFATEKGRQYVKGFERYAETQDLLTAQQKSLESLFNTPKEKVLNYPRNLK